MKDYMGLWRSRCIRHSPLIHRRPSYAPAHQDTRRSAGVELRLYDPPNMFSIQIPNINFSHYPILFFGNFFETSKDLLQLTFHINLPRLRCHNILFCQLEAVGSTNPENNKILEETYLYGGVSHCVYSKDPVWPLKSSEITWGQSTQHLQNTPPLNH